MIDPLGGLPPQLPAEPTPKTTAEAAKQFEALFVQQLLKEMPVAGLGAEGEQWMGMFREQVARALVDAGGFGLAEQLAGVLGPGTPAAPPPTPLAGARITSRFGERTDPIDGTRKRHAGLDLAAPLGTLIRSAGAGTVKFAGTEGGYGNVVIVDHGGGLESRYAHCQSLSVKVGDRLAAGDALATVGATGRATGPHVHFEVRKDGIAIDPQKSSLDPQLVLTWIRDEDQPESHSEDAP